MVGHNDVMMHAPVTLEVMRCFGDIEASGSLV